MSAPASKRLKRSYSSFVDSSFSAAAAAAAPVDFVQSRQIGALQRKVRKLTAQTEERNHFVTLSNTGVGTAGYILGLDTVAQGDTSRLRDGLAIKPTRLEWNMVLESETADAYNVMRLMIVQSKKGPLNVADFPSVHSPVSTEQLSKFSVLYDKAFMLENISTSGNGVTTLFSHYTHSKGSVRVPRKIFFTDGSVYAHTNNLYAFWVSDSLVVNHPDVEEFYSRLTWEE